MRSVPVWLRSARVLLLPVGWLSERLGNRFFVVLAVAIFGLALWALEAGLTRGMQNQVYDLILKNRFNVPPPGAEIVLVDIDEASLAAMSGEYGRWPWPRSVLAELIEAIAAAGPRAIVFDITFADRDVDHPDADDYLRRVAGATRTTFYSMIRLNPANDRLSLLRMADLAGVRRIGSAASADATVAMTVPFFHRELDGLRLGTNNLYTSGDGVARRYHVYRESEGWRIGSLPANVVAALGRPLPDTPDVLLNWRGPPNAYERVSFHGLHRRLLSSGGEAAAMAFRDRIVVVGSTAPSLFDIKPTPMGREHPGLEILATALDNLYAGDFLRPVPAWIYGLVTAGALGLLALAFVYNLDYRLLNPIFTTVQIGFVAVSYLGLNYSTVFIDLSAPFAAGLVYFSIARSYAFGLNLRRNGNALLSLRLDPGRPAQVLLVRCTVRGEPKNARRLRALLLRQAGLTRLGVAAPRVFRQSPLLNAHYRDMLLIYWLVGPEETGAALGDLYDMLGDNLTVLDARHDDDVRFQLDAFDFVVEEGRDWRRPGRAALTRAFADQGPATDARRVIVLDSFSAVCRAHPEVPVPRQLRAAGLDLVGK